MQPNSQVADGKPLPGLATVAIQEARHVARAIRDGLPSLDASSSYLDKGALAVVGRGRAVCEVRGIGCPDRRIPMYMGVHLFYLGGVSGRRITVLTTWLSAGLGSLQGRVMDGELASAEHGAEVTNGPWPSKERPMPVAIRIVPEKMSRADYERCSRNSTPLGQPIPKAAPHTSATGT